jgi:acyl-coenzyme A thioesterase PaaI-like protein
MIRMSNSPYFQDHMHENVCFGCGIANPQGLQIKSTWEEEVSVCHYQPREEHHGFPGLLCGGVLATLIDCHAMCTSVAILCREAGRPLEEIANFGAITGGLSIRYLAPTPTHGALKLTAELVTREGRKMQLRCTSNVGGVQTASAEVTIIEMDGAKMGALHSVRA